jgi:hypothetical protein
MSKTANRLIDLIEEFGTLTFIVVLFFGLPALAITCDSCAADRKERNQLELKRLELELQNKH